MKREVQMDVVWGNVVKDALERSRSLYRLGGRVEIWKGFWGCVKGIHLGEFCYGGLSFLEINETITAQGCYCQI